MAFTTYDTPAEFFNISPTTGAYSIASATISLGCSDHATPANRFLTNLTAAQAALAGSTAQVIFGLFDAIYERFNDIATADKPTKFNITKTGYLDPTTGEMIYNFTAQMRTSVGTPEALNS